MRRKFNPSSRGFTIVEISVVIGLLATLIAIAVPFALDSFEESKRTGAKATMKVLNEAAQRAKLEGLSGAGTEGSDKVAALNWYFDQSLVPNVPEANIEPLFYLSGRWGIKALPDDPAEVLAMVTPYQPTPAEAWAAMQLQWGTDPESVARGVGYYGTPSVEAMLAAYGVTSPEEMATKLGYASVEAMLAAYLPGSWSSDLSMENLARRFRYVVPGSALPDLLAKTGYSTIEDFALNYNNGQYSQPRYPSLSNDEVLELSARMGEFSPEVYDFLSKNNRISPESLVFLQSGIVNNYIDGKINSWSNSQLQDTQFNILKQMATSQRNPYLSQMDFSGIDLAGRDIRNAVLRGSNIAGAEVAKASNIIHADISGLDFAGANFSGLNMVGVKIRGATNFDGSMLNGTTDVASTVLEGLDLSNWTTVPFVTDWTRISSLANSKVNDTIMNHYISRLTNLTGVDLGFWRPTGVFATNFVGVTNFAGSQIQGHIYWAPSMGTVDMSGYQFQGRVISGDFSKVTGMTGSDLNKLASMYHDNIFPINLSGRDLVGWQPTYNITRANLSNTKNISATNLATATAIRGVNLLGTGITRDQLVMALGEKYGTEGFTPEDLDTIRFN